MENFELIEKYVTGQLESEEKQAFEKQLQADSSLQHDVALQQRIIEGIKKARVAQLKTMLNQVPVGGSMQAGLSAGQILTSAVTATLIITGTLLYFKPWKVKSELTSANNETPVIVESQKKDSKIGLNSVQPKDEPIISEVEKPKIELKKSITTKSLVKPAQPKIDVIDPTEELTQGQSETKKTEKNQSKVIASHIAVETDNSNSKYSFHYQFSQGKLVLYGSFDKGLYEILEVHGENHSVFLYYKENYYHLNEKQFTITPLNPIKDLQLVKLLKEYRDK